MQITPSDHVKADSNQERPNTTNQDITDVNNKYVCFRITSWSNLVQWQPPDDSRHASDIEVGTDVNYFISCNLRR